jgi:hypothetical protein
VTASEVTDKGCPDWQGGEQSMQGKCLLAAVALLLTAALATAQETTTGSIAGRVVDAQELASQYELGYMPLRPGGDGAFRRVAIRVPAPTNALARTRSGYYAPRAPKGM